MSVKIEVESGYYTTRATVTENVGSAAFALSKTYKISVLNYSGRKPVCFWDTTPTDSAKAKVDQYFGDCEHIVE